MHNIFVYGTLLNRDTLESIVGSSKTTYGDVLLNYRKVGLNVIEEEGSEVQGATFEVNDDELARLDAYEGVAHGLYDRKEVKLVSGEVAMVYTKCNPEQAVFGVGEVG